MRRRILNLNNHVLSTSESYEVEVNLQEILWKKEMNWVDGQCNMKFKAMENSKNLYYTTIKFNHRKLSISREY